MEKESIFRFSDVSPHDFTTYIQSELLYLKTQNRSKHKTLYTRISGINLLWNNTGRVKDVFSFNPTKEYKSLYMYCKHLLPKKHITQKTKEIPYPVAIQIVNSCLKYINDSDEIVKHFKYLFDYKIQNYNSNNPKASKYYLTYCRRNYKSAIQEGIIPKPNFDPQKQISKLNTACMIIIQLFTGMRQDELLALETGGLTKVETKMFDSSLYFVEGYLSKSRVKAKKVKWFCPDIVAKAYLILEDISKYIHPNTKKLLLFTERVLLKSIRKKHKALSDGVYRIALKKFVGDHDIKDETGELWPIQSHQFRKTYARIMADNGCDIGLLRLQLKHKTIDMTAHYGDPDLARLIFDERSTIQSTGIENLLANTHSVAGPGKNKVENWATQFNGLSTDKAKTKFIQDLASTLNIQSNGIGLCITDPSRDIKCNGAAFGSCDPACQHLVVPMLTHKRIYDDAITQIKHLLKHRAHNNIQKIQLQADLEHYEDVAKEWS
jgi:integrase